MAGLSAQFRFFLHRLNIFVSLFTFIFLNVTYIRLLCEQFTAQKNPHAQNIVISMWTKPKARVCFHINASRTPLLIRCLLPQQHCRALVYPMPPQGSEHRLVLPWTEDNEEHITLVFLWQPFSCLFKVVSYFFLSNNNRLVPYQSPLVRVGTLKGVLTNAGLRWLLLLLIFSSVASIIAIYSRQDVNNLFFIILEGIPPCFQWVFKFNHLLV